MPDDMLEDAIAISKKTLDEHDFETDGVEVSPNSNCFLLLVEETCQKYNACLLIDRQEGQEAHG